MGKWHSFHIPVMGIGYTLDSAIKVSQWGINTVASLVDDILIEKLRQHFCEKFSKPYVEISAKEFDSRANRITAYLNLLVDIVEEQRALVGYTSESKKKFIETYLSLLPLEIRGKLQVQISKMMDTNCQWSEILQILEPGNIDVNIMTKSDKENFYDNEKLSREFNDAHAALRGFANSKLQSSIIFSAGLNQKLFQYLETLETFLPDAQGNFKKKITLKVSDYRSAYIQGKILAKAGIWVSEYRLESGLNCGGHAFATDGLLMGPALEEFLHNREELEESLFEILKKSLTKKNKEIPQTRPKVKYTAQGGVGTFEEHQFLLNRYKLDSVGWGTPFLLVPEATSVDIETLKKLCEATEDDLYLSNTSPYGIPFHTLRNNSKDLEKQANIDKGRPGSACPKKYVLLNDEFSKEKICVASREYQYLKLKQLDAMKPSISQEEYDYKYNSIVEKACICVGLGTSIMLSNGIDTKVEGAGVSICPGPSMAYFSKVLTLSQMVNHIYGRENHMHVLERPNFFIKELNLYLKVLEGRVNEPPYSPNIPTAKFVAEYISNLRAGLLYYDKIFKEHFLVEGVSNLIKEQLIEANRKILEIETKYKPASV